MNKKVYNFLSMDMICLGINLYKDQYLVYKIETKQQIKF